MRIVLIGSGNVATHLGKALYNAGHEVVQVFSLTLKNAINLSASIESAGINDMNALDVNAEIYILSVKDDVLPDVIERLPGVNGLVVHTSGSVGIKVLSRFNNYGVFYPFQTFTKDKEVDFESIPVLIEASDDQNLHTLKLLGSSVSTNVSEVSSSQRSQLHLSAVFACNFVNYMYRLAADLLQESDLSFDIIKPLILETAEKVKYLPPGQTQTGPASRNDQQIIQKHLKILKGDKELSQIYELLTSSILNNR